MAVIGDVPSQLQTVEQLLHHAGDQLASGQLGGLCTTLTSVLAVLDGNDLAAELDHELDVEHTVLTATFGDPAARSVPLTLVH